MNQSIKAYLSSDFTVFPAHKEMLIVFAAGTLNKAYCVYNNSPFPKKLKFLICQCLTHLLRAILSLVTQFAGALHDKPRNGYKQTSV